MKFQLSFFRTSIESDILLNFSVLEILKNNECEMFLFFLNQMP